MPFASVTWAGASPAASLGSHLPFGSLRPPETAKGGSFQLPSLPFSVPTDGRCTEIAIPRGLGG